MSEKLSTTPPEKDNLAYQVYARGYAKQGMQDAMLEYHAYGRTAFPTHWLDEVTTLDVWAEEYITARRAEDFRKQYMQEWPTLTNPWDNAGEELARMIADGCSRSHIRKAFLNYYPSMTNTDVNRMLQQYEEQHGPLF